MGFGAVSLARHWSYSTSQHDYDKRFAHSSSCPLLIYPNLYPDRVEQCCSLEASKTIEFDDQKSQLDDNLHTNLVSSSTNNRAITTILLKERLSPETSLPYAHNNLIRRGASYSSSNSLEEDASASSPYPKSSCSFSSLRSLAEPSPSGQTSPFSFLRQPSSDSVFSSSTSVGETSFSSNDLSQSDSFSLVSAKYIQSLLQSAAWRVLENIRSSPWYFSHELRTLLYNGTTAWKTGYGNLPDQRERSGMDYPFFGPTHDNNEGRENRIISTGRSVLAHGENNAFQRTPVEIQTEPIIVYPNDECTEINCDNNRRQLPARSISASSPSGKTIIESNKQPKAASGRCFGRGPLRILPETICSPINKEDLLYSDYADIYGANGFRRHTVDGGEYVKHKTYDVSSSSSSSPLIMHRCSLNEKETLLDELPIDIYILICFYLEGEDLARCSCLNRSWHNVSYNLQQPLWQELVLRKYGFKYENYMIYCGLTDWHLMYAKATTFLRNLRQANPVVTYFTNALIPPIEGYRGTLALTADCTILLWENGTYLQAIDVSTANELFRTRIEGSRFDNDSQPCLVNSKNNIFFHLKREIHVFCMETGSPRGLLQLPKETDEHGKLHEWEPTDYSLDVSIRNQQVTFLTNNSLFVFDSSTLQLAYKITHKEIRPEGGIVDTDVDFLWAGYFCVSNNNAGMRRTFDGHNGCSCNGENIKTDCRRKSKHIVTWLKRKGKDIKVFDVCTGALLVKMIGHRHNILRVRQAQNRNRLEDYSLASLDTNGDVFIWDSTDNLFTCIQKLNASGDPSIPVPYHDSRSETPSNELVDESVSSTTAVPEADTSSTTRVVDRNKDVVFRISFSSTHLMTMTETRRQKPLRVLSDHPFHISQRQCSRQTGGATTTTYNPSSYEENIPEDYVDTYKATILKVWQFNSEGFKDSRDRFNNYNIFNKYALPEEKTVSHIEADSTEKAFYNKEDIELSSGLSNTIANGAGGGNNDNDRSEQVDFIDDFDITRNRRSLGTVIVQKSVKHEKNLKAFVETCRRLTPQPKADQEIRRRSLVSLSSGDRYFSSDNRSLSLKDKIDFEKSIGLQQSQAKDVSPLIVPRRRASCRACTRLTDENCSSHKSYGHDKICVYTESSMPSFDNNIRRTTSMQDYTNSRNKNKDCKVLPAFSKNELLDCFKENTKVLEEVSSFVVPDAAYFADFLDNQLIGIWMSPHSSSNDFNSSLSDWKVFNCFDYLPDTGMNQIGYSGSSKTSTTNNLKISKDEIKSCQESTKNPSNNKCCPEELFGLKESFVFNINGRGDVWTLLDWKCFSINQHGDLHIYDFCPIADATKKNCGS